jgi:peptidoglycan biosynthesis protein MviN/MurJ (putative lipid II flippase)
MVVGVLTAILSLAVPAWIVQQIAVRGFYARGDTWRPMVLGTVISIAVIPLYLYLMRLENVFGLALAGVIAMTLNTLVTLFFARGLYKAPPLLPLLTTFGRSLLIALPAGFAARAALSLRHEYLPLDQASVKIKALADLAGGGAAFGIVALAGILLIGDTGLRTFMRKMIP